MRFYCSCFGFPYFSGNIFLNLDGWMITKRKLPSDQFSDTAPSAKSIRLIYEPREGSIHFIKDHTYSFECITFMQRQLCHLMLFVLIVNLTSNLVRVLAILREARQIQSLIDDFLMTKCPLRGSISFKNRDSCFGDTDQKDVPAVFLEGET